MKLGEAKIELEIINSQLNILKLKIVNKPKDKINNILKDISNILLKKQNLEQRICKTESNLAIGKNKLTELQGALKLLDQKISVLEIILIREDLEEKSKTNIENKIMFYQSTKYNLNSVIKKYIWKTVLVTE